MGLSAQQALGAVDNLVQGEAVMLATNHIFLISALMFLFGACVVWLAPKPTGQVAPGAGGH